jgi:hypothetical protein
MHHYVGAFLKEAEEYLCLFRHSNPQLLERTE